MLLFSHLPYCSFHNSKYHQWYHLYHLCRLHHHPNYHSPTLYLYPNYPDPLPHCSMPSSLFFGARDINVNTPQWSYMLNQPLPPPMTPWRMKQTPNQIPIVLWRTHHHLLNRHLFCLHLKSGNHTNQWEEDMEQPMLSSMESNSQNHEGNSMKKQDHPQQKRDQCPQLAKCLLQNTSLVLKGN